MKNSMFSGWKDILLFTFRQGINKKYKMVTLILVVVLFAGGFGFNLIFANRQKSTDNISPVEKVYLIDNSGIEDIKWNESKKIDSEKFPKVTFEQTSSDVKELGLKLMNNETTSVIAEISKKKDSFDIQIYIPFESEVSEDDGKNLAKTVRDVLYEGIINKSEIDIDKIVYVVSGISTEYSTAGEETQNDSAMMFKSMFPLFFMLGLYFMVIIYGQSMGQVVCIEKSSKLMETLLVMTRPYGLIFGKILATAGIAIFQMAVCVVSLLAGFFIGDNFARNSIYAEYDNSLLSMFGEIASEEGGNAFSNEAIVLTVVAICLAFVFYCMLAGAIASFASKADELGSVMMFYNLFLVIGFLGSYALPTANGQEWIKVLVRLVPLSSAFMLPGEILLGTVKSGAAVIYLLVLLGWIVVAAIFAGKIYRDQVFYNGKSLKDRLPWMKNNKDEDGDGQWQLLHDEAGRPLEKSQKIGYFFLAISPLAIFFVIQIFASLVLTNVMTRAGLKGIELSTWEAKDYADFYHGIEPTLNPLTVMVSHLLIITTFGIWMYLVRKGIDSKNVIHIRELFSKKVLSNTQGKIFKQILAIVGICVICGLCLCAFANGTVAIQAVLVPSVVEDYLEMAQSAGFGTSPFAIAAAVCLAPIGEELLCRGICLHFGKKAFGKFWYANVLQALMFGILHMNWVQGVYAFFIGLVLGILVERYKSLLPSMLVHFVVNFSASTWAPKVIGKLDMNLGMGIAFVAIAVIVITAVLYFSGKNLEVYAE